MNKDQWPLIRALEQFASLTVNHRIKETHTHIRTHTHTHTHTHTQHTHTHTHTHYTFN